MLAPRLLTLRLAPLALILALAACDERTPSTPPPDATPGALRVSAGDGQTGVVGAELPSDLAVEVVDAGGRPMAGIAVQFAVVAGGGQVAAATATTDASGVARTRWTLGTAAADSQVVEARVAQVAPVRLRALVRAAAPAALALAGGNGGAGPVGGALADSLAVTVKDRYGNPVAGLEVAWEAVAGGGSTSPARTATGADGTARTRWTLGPRVDSAQVALARVAGLDSVVFTANAVTAGAPLLLSKRSGDGQRGTAGGVLADSLGVLLRMPDGRPVAGAIVSWSVPPAAGVVSPAVTRTDAYGAASATWRLGTTPGLAQARVTVDSGTLIFTSLTEADAPAAAVAASGGGAGGVGQALADSLAVRVTDRHGNPVPGAAVDWTASSGGGAVLPARSVTGADGIARAQWTLGPAVGGQAARGTVAGLPAIAFSATVGTAGVPLALAKRGGDGQRGPVGSLLADSLGVVLRLPDGRGVSGAVVRWTVPAGGGSVSRAETRTDADGTASTLWRLGMTTGLAQAAATVDEGTLVFTALVEAEAAAHLAVVAGDGGTGGVGSALADSLAVRVADRHGNPVAGVAVDWSAQTGGGSVLPARSTTGADGIARTRWTLGPAVGGQTARATVAGLAPAAFSATAATAGVPLALAKRGGDGQRGPVGSLLADSLGVVLRLPDGRGVSGAVVRWAAPADGGSVSPAETRTDADGTASTTWRLGMTTGLAQATATVDEGSLVFTALVEAEAAAQLAIVSGDGGTGGVGSALADSLAVRVTDRHGNPVAGAAVDWSAQTGGGAVLPARSVTGADGIARTRWTLGPAVGGQTARATVAGLAPATFSATAGTGGVTLALAKRGGDGQRGPVGSLLADSLGVTLQLPDGRGVSGALVRWSVPAGGGSVSPGETRTDALGRAGAAWRLGTEAGLRQATAAVDAGTLVFTALAESGAPAQVAVAGGDGLTGPVGGHLGDSLAARVTDASGNPVAGVTVDWTLLSGNGNLYPEQSTTDAAGIARTMWTLGVNVGAVHRAQAGVAGLPPATFSATATTAGVTLLLTRRRGEGQRGFVGTLLADSLGVVLRLPDGRGVSGARVVWNTASGSVTPAETRTDGRGRTAAMWRLGPDFGVVQATAAVDEGTLVFTALAENDAPGVLAIVAGDGQTGPVGGAVADSLAVRISGASGSLAGVVVDWTVAAGEGTVEPARGVTDAQGIARARWTLGPIAGAAHTARATVVGLPPASFSAQGTTAGVPLQLARRGGDGQRAMAGSLLADSLGVTLRLADGRGVAGALVQWSTGSGEVTPAQGRTDAQGRAAATWRLGPAAGLVQATATVDEGVLTFTAQADPGAAAILAVAGGNGATGGVGRALADSLAVRATDRLGNPLAGVSVSWSAAAGNGSVLPVQSVTDAGGIARTRWTLGLVADSAQTARAAVAGVPPVAFTATGRTQGVALQLVRRAGNGQTGTGGSVLADSLVAELRTPAGDPVRNALVTWAVTAGGGSVSPASTRTDALGRARTEWLLGSTAGSAQATATVDGAALSFAATQTASTRTATVAGGGGQTQTRGTMLQPISVRVTDAGGAPAAGVEVRFVAAEGGGFAPEDAVTLTDGAGIARVRWVLGPAAGENRISVRAAGAPEVTVTATGVDAVLRLAAGPPFVVRLNPIPNHSSYGYMDSVPVRVVDPASRPVWGVPVRFEPNQGEAGATVLTGGLDGNASFFWEGWMRESDLTIPVLRISAVGEETRLQAEWDAGERQYEVNPDLKMRYKENTDDGIYVDVSEVNGLSVPQGLPVFFSDGFGWSAWTVAGGTVDWQVSPGVGNRILTFCVISTDHTCWEFQVEVVPEDWGP
jgi:hypothetical protein